MHHHLHLLDLNAPSSPLQIYIPIKAWCKSRFTHHTYHDFVLTLLMIRLNNSIPGTEIYKYLPKLSHCDLILAKTALRNLTAKLAQIS